MYNTPFNDADYPDRIFFERAVNEYIKHAYGILDGMVADRECVERLASVTGSDILDLLGLAAKVKAQFAPEFRVCAIINAKSGACPEDCRFCAQSAHHACRIDEYPLLPSEQIMSRAAAAYEAGATHFGIVTGGTGYLKTEGEFSRVLDVVGQIRESFPDKGVCLSLGHLTDETAAAAAARGISSYNLNLQTSPARYRDLAATTHTAGERMSTLILLKKHRVPICCGGIIGLGETMADRIDLAFTLRDLEPAVIPLNVLIPIPGTPLAGSPPPTAAEVTVTFAIFRLVHPCAIIIFAAGRETVMRDFQGLIMTTANGFISGGYLTTRGRSMEDDITFMREIKRFS